MSKKLERNVRLACDVEYKEISGCNGVLVYHVTKIYLCLNEQEEVALRQESLSAEELLERTTKILELGVGPVATTVKVDRATKERPQYRVSPGIQVSGR